VTWQVREVDGQGCDDAEHEEKENDESIGENLAYKAKSTGPAADALH